MLTHILSDGGCKMRIKYYHGEEDFTIVRALLDGAGS
jgi:hypothetical protein